MTFSPRDLGMKKRQHPDDELHLSFSIPKRLFFSSKAESVSALGHPVVSSCSAVNTPHGSIWSLTSPPFFNSDCTTRGCGVEQSSFSMNTARCTLNSTQSSISGDFTSYKFGPLADTGEPPLDDQDKQKLFSGPYVYSNDGSLNSEVEVSAVTVSELTADRSVHTLSPSGGPQEAGNVTHVISRREAGSFGTKVVSDERWHKLSRGYGDCATWGRQEDKSRMLLGARQSRDKTLSSTGSENGAPCLTEDSFCGAVGVGLKQGFTDVYGCACMESQDLSRAHNLAGSKPHQSIGWTDYRGGHRRSCPEGLSESIISSNGVLQCSSVEALPQAYASRDGVCEESGASYVLSSGRLSLEEEARLGRRAPTIDHEFEEYFAALML